MTGKEALAALRAGLKGSGPLPPSSVMQLADVELTLIMGEAREAVEDMARIRQILIDFGALASGDHVTGVADLIEILLPPAGE